MTKTYSSIINGLSIAEGDVPFLDALNVGYIGELQSDIQCSVDDDNNHFLEWLQNEAIFNVHGENTEFITPPHGYNKRVVKYLWNTLPKTPKVIPFSTTVNTP